MDQSQVKRKHTLTVIGYMGIKRAYLDMPFPEAKALFEKENGEVEAYNCRIFSFDRTFAVYDAWKHED